MRLCIYYQNVILIFAVLKNDEYPNVSYFFRWAKASAAVKAGYQAKSDKDKARYAAEKAKFAAKK